MFQYFYHKNISKDVKMLEVVWWEFFFFMKDRKNELLIPTVSEKKITEFKVADGALAYNDFYQVFVKF